jgi:uncharacterized membrane protein
VGIRTDSRKTRLLALGIALLVAFRLVAFDSSFTPALTPDFTFMFNRRGLTFLIAVLSLFGIAYLYSQNRQHLTREELPLVAGIVIFANLLILFFLTTEIANRFDARYYQASDYGMRRDIRSRMQLAVSALWALYSILLVIIGIVRKFQPIRLLAILLFAVTILKVFFVDLQEMDKIYRIVASIGLGVILLAASMMYQKFRTQINDFVLK